MKNKKRWTKDENQTLTKFYGKISIKDIMNMFLPDRTENAISGHARYLKLAGNQTYLNSFYHTKSHIVNNKKTCSVCNIEKPIEEFNRKKSSATGYGPRCKKCTNEYLNQWALELKNKQRRRKYVKNCRARMRKKILDHYGNKCSCPKCPETNTAFLSIEHLDGGGKFIRKERGEYGSLKDIIDSNFPDNITVLCYNCNFAKYKNGGICPHLSSSVFSNEGDT